MKSSTGESKNIEHKIYITGDYPIVAEYAEMCADSGFKVFIPNYDTSDRKSHPKKRNIQTTNTIPASISIAIELTNIDLETKRSNLEKLDKKIPPEYPILSSSITVTATEQASWITNKYRLVGISALPTLVNKPLVEVAPTVYSPKETIKTVSKFFALLGKEIEIVQDRIGMVYPRVICRVINEAFCAITEDITKPEDLDTALKYGVNFPMGPLEWAEKIGFDQIIAVISALKNDISQEHYNISPLLKQMSLIRSNNKI